mgnify:CR=1 FL=1
MVLEAGIDIDLTTLKLIGTRGVMIALVGTFLPVILAYSIAFILGYRGSAAIAAGCVFAPTSLGIAMNVLRRSGIINTPVGQLIVAAAIIDDMVALVILSQLQAFAAADATALDMAIPIVSALGFLIIGGSLAIFVLPKYLNKYILDPIEASGRGSRDWASMAIMFSFLMLLVPLTYYSKASPLMGAFLAGLIFCSDHGAHHMFVSQFKRVMQWLLRIFFAASIGFQVPFGKFGDVKVLLQGLVFTLALLGKVGVGFMVPNFWEVKKFKYTHLRDCLVVGFSMAAEGEFAFVIAVFAVTNNMITQDLYASVVLAVLASTIIAPFCLESTISYFNKQTQSEVLGQGEDPDALLEKGVRERTVVFFCIQTRSAPAWGLAVGINGALSKLNLDVIDHRSWHPRQSMDTLVNEIYVKDDAAAAGNLSDNDAQELVNNRIDDITSELAKTIKQPEALIMVQRWFPEIADDSSERSISEDIVEATSKALESSMREHQAHPAQQPYARMEDDNRKYPTMKKRREKQIKHLDSMFKGKLEGLFRHDSIADRFQVAQSEGGIELLDTHGIGTGRYESPHPDYDYHGREY